ncbi:MAG: NifU family protein [Candidatus Poseidoniaceae archaeon]|nr:NifU family protein [Candidatus Poseidoniaceae archaeon]MDG1557742.1 NifU family protein [Candidatus Poseidoniaceae archaeon]MDG1558274.1 NifU family protein [Candidatus Poseidoniaceae archaeon]
MVEDELVAAYAAEAKAAMSAEAAKRIAETVDPKEEKRLRSTSLLTLINTSDMVPALLSRLGEVRAALDGHGGGIAISALNWAEDGSEALDLVLDLTGACLSCGAAPGTLEGVKNDLEGDSEIVRVQFDKALLDTFDELGREFILVHGKVQFV